MERQEPSGRQKDTVRGNLGISSGNLLPNEEPKPVKVNMKRKKRKRKKLSRIKEIHKKKKRSNKKTVYLNAHKHRN